MNTITLGTYLKGTPSARPATIAPVDWREHIYVAGKTGMGKSTFFQHLLNQMHAFCLIDGEGDLAKSIADSRPCIYWRARNYDRPIGINPLINVPKDERSRVTAEMVALLSDFFELDAAKTPQLLHWLRATIRALLDAPGSTLLDMAPMLTDQDFRSLKLARCKDRWAKSVWRDFEAMKPKDQRQEIHSLLNKAEALRSYLPLQLTIGQAVSTIDFRVAMDKGKTIVCNLAGIGKEPARLLGAIILFSATSAAAARFDEAVAADTVEDLIDYPIAIDEFQNYATLTMPRILSEFRKRRFPLIIAHQYVSQLPAEVSDAIFANCGTLMSFRVGVDDAPRLASALDAPEDELKDLGRGKAWVAYQQNGVRTSAMPIDIPKPSLATGHLPRNVAVTDARTGVPRKDAERRRNIEDYKAWKARRRRIAREAGEAGKRGTAKLAERTLAEAAKDWQSGGADPYA